VLTIRRMHWTYIYLLMHAFCSYNSRYIQEIQEVYLSHTHTGYAVRWQSVDAQRNVQQNNTNIMIQLEGSEYPHYLQHKEQGFLCTWMCETYKNFIQVFFLNLISVNVYRPSSSPSPGLPPSWPLLPQFGKVYEVRMMMDFNGNNRGYAFVTFTTKQEAKTAMKQLNNYEIRCAPSPMATYLCKTSTQHFRSSWRWRRLFN